MSDKNKDSTEGFFWQVAIPVIVALLVGGTSPWWWQTFFGSSAAISNTTNNTALTLLASVLAVVLVLVLARRFSVSAEEKNRREKSRARRLKGKYKNLSIVGVYLNRYQDFYDSSKAILLVSICTHIIIVQSTPIPFRIDFLIVPIVFLVSITLQKFIVSYRIKKGFYLNNEAEAREMIKFIRDNSDDIDFNDGSREILSKSDLEEIVLGSVEYNQA